MRFAKLSLLTVFVLSASCANAQTFEIIDGSANVSGQPASGTEEARANWNQSCERWKTETKELNKNDQVMALSCESPTCTFSSDNGKTSCSSNAIFKVKTQGTRAQPQPQQEIVTTQPEKEIIVEQAPTQVVYEPAPAPRLGFLWLAGYWSWVGHRHVWHGGRWERHPGYGYGYHSPSYAYHRPAYDYYHQPSWDHGGHDSHNHQGGWHH